MLIYKSESDVITSSAKYIQSKIDLLTKEINGITNKNTLAYKTLIARRAAYSDALYLLTNYTIQP